MKINGLITLCLMLPTLVYSQVTEVSQRQEKIGVTQETPIEELMREHGVVDRALLIYDNLLTRLTAGEVDKIAQLHKVATIFRTFIENYHETLEEVYIFPKFQKEELMPDLIQTLLEQHAEGRKCTDFYLSHNEKDLKNPEMLAGLCATLKKQILMYREHTAREDTVLFPAFKLLITQEEYNSLGEIFTDKEQGLFGRAGFTRVVESIATIEKELGIYDLAKYDVN